MMVPGSVVVFCHSHTQRCDVPFFPFTGGLCIAVKCRILLLAFLALKIAPRSHEFMHQMAKWVFSSVIYIFISFFLLFVFQVMFCMNSFSKSWSKGKLVCSSHPSSTLGTLSMLSQRSYCTRIMMKVTVSFLQELPFTEANRNYVIFLLQSYLNKAALLSLTP